MSILTRRIIAALCLVFTSPLMAESFRDDFDQTQLDLNIAVRPTEQTCVTPPTGLVAWWRGESNGYDGAGAHDGAVQNGLMFGPGVAGQAFRFDGVDDQLVVPDAPSLRGIGAMTIEFWVNFSRLPRTGGWEDSMIIIEKADDYFIAWRADYDFMNFSVTDACDGLYHLDIYVPLPALLAGDWHHFAFVAIDRGPYEMRAYMDGIEQLARRDSPHEWCRFFDGVTGDLHLGTRPVANGPTLPLHGLIDEMSIYDRALSTEEIRSIVAAGGAGKCQRTPPSIICPEAIDMVTDSGSCSTLVDGGIVTTGDPQPALACTAAGQPITWPHAFPTGATSVMCTAKNGLSPDASCSFDVNVHDAEAPVISEIIPSARELRPPNHKMRDVTLSYAVTDNCGAPQCTLSVWSNEPLNGTGDGGTSPDWEIVDATHVRLRAERAGNGGGRVYTITATCVDGFGKRTSRSTQVSVPHH